jgi:hypothetical protein
MRPVIIYVSVVVVLGLLLAAWQYRYEQARRPPPADVIVRNLTETFVGEDTVKAVRLEGTTAEMEISMDGVRALPENRGDWPQFFTDVTDVAAGRLFQPPPQLQDEQVRSLQTVIIRYTLEGREIARGTKTRGAERATVTMQH